jgi:hypothetical protein
MSAEHSLIPPAIYLIEELLTNNFTVPDLVNTNFCKQLFTAAFGREVKLEPEGERVSINDGCGGFQPFNAFYDGLEIFPVGADGVNPFTFLAIAIGISQFGAYNVR